MQKLTRHLLGATMLMFAASSCTSSGTVREVQQSPPIELAIACFDCDYIANEGDVIYAYLQERLNLAIKVHSYPYADYAHKLDTMLATAEIPDLFFGPGVDVMDQYKAWIAEGFLLPLSDAAADYPHLNRMLQRFEPLRLANGGTLYGLPVVSYLQSSKPVINDHVMYVRKDWLDRLQLSVPESIADFYTVARAFAMSDPDGNGHADTYGYSSQQEGYWWHYPLYNAFGTSLDRFYKAEGRWAPELLRPQTKEAVAFLRKLYHEHIMDPDFMINTREQLIKKFVDGEVGIIFANGGRFYHELYEMFEQAYPQQDPLAMFTYGGILKGHDGTKRLDGFNNYWMFTFASARSAPEVQEKALELLDFLASDEGITLMRWGLEGKHYKEEGGEKINLLPYSDKGGQYSIEGVFGTARLKSFITWDADYMPAGSRNRREMSIVGAEGIANATPDPLIGLHVDSEELPAELPQRLAVLIGKGIVDLIAGEAPFDEGWELLVQQWLDSGGARMWEAVNKQALAEGR